MSYLDDSADLIRATAVSRSWYRFVISNRLSKKMCARKVPALASICCVVEENNRIVKMLEGVVSWNSTDLETLEKEHKIYSSLLQFLAEPFRFTENCMALTVGLLSSTYCCPAENILNVHGPSKEFTFGYFSDKPNVPEHIIYQLKTPTCIVKGISITPFEDFTMWDNLILPRHVRRIYSGKSIRFRMGHPKSSGDLVEMGGTHVCPSQQPSLDNYLWTYTSPVFSLNPNSFEPPRHYFKLPEPTICMGGFLHIEVLDRIQEAENHEHYYIFVFNLSSVQVISKMEIGINFVDCFPNDVVCKIMSYLDDSADLIRATAVSRSWCHFVISNRLSKEMCFRKVPSLESIACVVEENNGIVKILEDVVLMNSPDLKILEKEHEIYSSLLGVLAKPIGEPINYRARTVGVLYSTDCESAENTRNVLNRSRRSQFGYFPDKPIVPEHIIYQLKTPTCIVRTICILPSKDTLVRFRSFPISTRRRMPPIISEKSIHFRMGHPKSAGHLVEMGGTHVRPSQQPSLDDYVWTYTSPVFSLDPNFVLQTFELPEPTLCMGGFLHIEVLDQIQREENGGYLCICMGIVCVKGVPLEPAFKLEMFPSRALEFKYYPKVLKKIRERQAMSDFDKLLNMLLDSEALNLRMG